MASKRDNKVNATTVNATGENIVDLNTPEPDRTDDILDGAVEGFSQSVGEKKVIGSAVGDVSPVDNGIQKKIRRAERFGVSVKLTEEEKRNSRAERFGNVAAANEPDGTKKAEELKRKARADRFGVPPPTSTSNKTEEEAKKKARLSRFGKDTKIDSVEADKRQARALRFSKPASVSSSDLPGKQNIGKETAISGYAA